MKQERDEDPVERAGRDEWDGDGMRATVKCPLCQGFACEKGCGKCWDANVGPDSHKVCRRCKGAGVIQHEVFGNVPPPDLQ